jgi:predicted acyltransferase
MANPAPSRVLSIDAFRGFVMFLMMAEVLRLPKMAQHFSPGTFWGNFWSWVGFNTSHVDWYGCSLHDLIQPSFSFLVGVSLPFSIASREAKGQSRWRMLAHAVWRAILLVALGIFLRSIGKPQTNFMFTDTLGQIGLGYVFLFLIGLCWQPVQWGALVLILGGYWALFAYWPLPSAEFDYQSVGVSAAWRQEHSYDDFRAHWNLNTNPAMEFDKWFLNQFPRAKEFKYEKEGYATLNFIPTLATMILGLLAGGWLRQPWPSWQKWGLFIVVGLACLGAGYALDYFQICPIVKKIWTPAWVLASGGATFLMLAGFYLVIEMIGFWQWSYPLLVIGANSIVAYCLAHDPIKSFVKDRLHAHLGKDLFLEFGPQWENMLIGAAVLLVFWLVLWWMYLNKIFVRI